MKRVMEAPRLTSLDMPVDGKRMIYGGFEAVLNR
jgi:uncharacterized protein YbaA (DUF1428 family)